MSYKAKFTHRPTSASRLATQEVEGSVPVLCHRHGRAERGEGVQLVLAVTVLVVGVVDGFLQRGLRLVLFGAVVLLYTASVWRESAVNARKGAIPRASLVGLLFLGSSHELLAIPRADSDTNNHRSTLVRWLRKGSCIIVGS